MNTLVIEKQTGGYFKFTLNGDTANAITSIQNDLLAVGTQLHFKTGNGANIIKEQFIYPADVTIIASGTFTFTTVAQVWDKLIDIDYFAWLGGGGTGGVDRFDDLLDTFSYTGNAGKAVVVDGSELRLVPITLYNKRLFTELEDTPSSLVPNKMLVVNPAGTAVVLQDQPEQPEQLLNSVGYFDYNDLITQTTPLNAVANVALKLTNDTEGANTSTDQNPYGVSYVWDYTTNAFNFSELEVGDTIDVRVHVQVTTTSANQRVLLSAKFGIGSIAEFTNIIYENQFKSAGLHEINFVAPFYMGSTYITDNPAELYLTTDSSATVKVDGWYVRILRKNINIITVDYTVPDATTTVKGIVRLAGDLAGTANSPTVPELANKVPTSRTVSTTSPLLGGGALSSNLTLSIQQANSVDSGYLTYADWGRFDEAHRDRIVSAAVTGTTTKTLTLTQHDAGTITTSWTDDNTDAVSSVFGRTGAVVAVSGDYTTSLVTESTNKNYQTDNQKLYNDATSSIQTQLNSKANDNAVVKLTGDQTISGVKTFSNPTIFNSSLNIASGAYSILYNPANSAYWQTYVDSSNVFNFGYNGNIVKASISNSGNFTANSFIKSGGTSSQFLKADGSVDSSTYLTSLSGAVLTTGDQSISGDKTFTTANRTTFQNADFAQIRFKNTGDLTKYLDIGYGSNGNIFSTTGLDFRVGGLTTAALSIASNENATFRENLTAKSFIKSGGTSLQFLKADGSVDSTTYQTALTNPITGTGTTNYIPKFTGSSAIGNSLIYDDGTNVGIGTTSPGQKLDVNGNANITGYALIGGSAYLASGNSLYFDSGVTNDYGIRKTGSSLILTTGGNFSMLGGNVGIGTSSPGGKLQVAGNTQLGNTIAQTYFGVGAAATKVTSNGSWAIGVDAADGSTERMRITSGGNVGIGTTSPNSKIQVLGVSGDPTLTAGTAAIATFTPNGVGTELVMGSSASSPFTFWMQNRHTGINGLSYPISLNPLGGNVGIGTTSPGGKLHVVGEGIFDDGTNGRLTFANASSQNDIYSTTTSFGGWKNLRLSSNELILSSGGNTERMRITSGGNVGIGTSSPVTKLHVDKTSQTIGGSTPNGGLVITNLAGSNYALEFGTDTSLSPWIQSRNAASASYYNLLLNPSGGNVGIGTTSPSTKLDVVGAITASGGFFNSDIRLKDLTEYEYKVSDIKPITYLWRDGRDNKKHVGYSAQEVQKVMPDAVNEGTDGMLSVNYVEVLVAKIAELENRIKQLEK